MIMTQRRQPVLLNKTGNADSDGGIHYQLGKC